MAATCEIDSCGVSAIGRCRDCAKAFCGSHQASILGGRAFVGEPRYADLCRPCLDRRQVDTQESAKQRRAAVVSRLQAIRDPVEKLVTAMVFARSSRDWSSYGHIAPAFPEYWAGGRPQLFVDHEGIYQYKVIDADGRLSSSPTRQRPWNSMRVAQWFAAKAISAGVKPNDEMKVTEKKLTIFGKVRTSEAPARRGWRLQGGSTAIGRNYGKFYKIDAFVFSDGALWLGEDEVDIDRKKVVPSIEQHAINELGLASIGQLLNMDLIL